MNPRPSPFPSRHFEFRITAEQVVLDGNHFCKAFAGADDGDGIPEPTDGRSDPSKVAVREVGPLPPGWYRIRGAEEHPTAGKWCMRLEPLPGTELYGRGGFLWHGDSVKHPGTGSKGCMVSARVDRKAAAALVAEGVHWLHVVP